VWTPLLPGEKSDDPAKTATRFGVTCRKHVYTANGAEAISVEG
jgi:hypothetical protein